MKGRQGEFWTDEFQDFLEPRPARHATLEWRCNTCDRPMSRVLNRAELRGPVPPKPSPEQCDPCRLEELMSRIEGAEAAIGQPLHLARSLVEDAIQNHMKRAVEYEFANRAMTKEPMSDQKLKFEVSKLADIPPMDEPWSISNAVVLARLFAHGRLHAIDCEIEPCTCRGGK